MRWGVDSGPLKNTLPYASYINAAAVYANCPVTLAYAIAWHESIQGEANRKWNAATVMSQNGDGGHGLFQLTSSYPNGWEQPYTNAVYAMENYIVPDCLYWYRHFGFTGETLVRCAAASFNAGLGGALRGHNEGDVDKYTTDNYAEKVLKIYRNLEQNGAP